MSINGIGMFLSCIVVFGMFFWSSAGEINIYFDFQSVFVVIIGTLVISIIAIPAKDVKLFFSMIKAVMKGQKDDWENIVDTYVEMAEKSRNSFDSLKGFVEGISDPFMKDGVQLLISGFSLQELQTIMRKRLEAQTERHMRQTKAFKAISKYPPACGLLGTVLGMIVLLGTLGQEGAGELIGPAMSVALVATLYGVIIANFFILPVADNLSLMAMESSAKREMIIEGLILLRRKESPILIKEYLTSHIPPAKRAKAS